MRQPHANIVQDAIDRLGGVTPAVLATRIPAATWVRYRRLGRISDPARVFLVADLTGLDPRQLAGLPGPTNQPEPPASTPEPSVAGSRGSVRRLPRRREEGPRVYGTIRGRNNCPLLLQAA